MAEKHYAKHRILTQSKEFKALMDSQRRNRLYQVGNLLRTEVVRGMRGKRSGRRYFVPGTRRAYTASAAGERPAWRTGELARSYRTAPSRPSQITNDILVGSELDYALYLEKGTPNRPPRPHLYPAFQAIKDRVKQILSGGMA